MKRKGLHVRFPWALRALMGNKKKEVLTHIIVSAPLGRGINIRDFKGEFGLIKQGQNESRVSVISLICEEADCVRAVCRPSESLLHFPSPPPHLLCHKGLNSHSLEGAIKRNAEPLVTIVPRLLPWQWLMVQRAGADPLLSDMAALTNTQLYDFSGKGWEEGWGEVEAFGARWLLAFVTLSVYCECNRLAPVYWLTCTCLLHWIQNVFPTERPFDLQYINYKEVFNTFVPY